jgi:RNA polymerase sigma-70 factor (ECF subfamily)
MQSYRRGGEKVEDFEAIYVQHFDGVYKYVFSLCRNETMAEEITQETFYRAMEHIDKFEGKCKLYVWLCQIAKNTFLTYAKKQKRHVSETDIDLSKQIEPSFENEILDKETVWKLHKLLHELSDPYKEVFSLRVFGELPFSQIGELFGKSDSWARLIFYRAKKELRRNLDENIV